MTACSAYFLHFILFRLLCPGNSPTHNIWVNLLWHQDDVINAGNVFSEALPREVSVDAPEKYFIFGMCISSSRCPLRLSRKAVAIPMGGLCGGLS